MEMDLISSFFARHESAMDEEAPVAHPTAAQAQQLTHDLIEIIDPLPLPQMSQEQRDDMAGKRFPDLQKLMFDCASGLRLSLEIAAKIDAPPETFEALARQDMEIGGFIKALQGLHEAADTTLLAAAGEANELCDTTDQLVLAHGSGAGPLDPASQVVLQNLFAEPARVRTEALAQAPRAKADPAPEDQQAAEERKRAVAEFLTDIKGGQATALGMRLAPGLGKAGAK
jgi:hypothetical protein